MKYEMSLFPKKAKIKDISALNNLFKDLSSIIKSFTSDAYRLSNTRIFTNVDINDRLKFLIESAILYIGRVIFLKYCKDNELFDINIKDDLYEIVNEFFDNFLVEYYEFSKLTYYDEFIPPKHVNKDLIRILNKYDFSGIDIDLIGKLYENFISKEEKILLGQVYTPNEVVDYILKTCGYVKEPNLETKKIIDISCGTGVFLVRAVKHLMNFLKSKYEDDIFVYETIQRNIWGLDINPLSLQIAELNLLISIFNLLIDIKKKHPNYKSKRFNLFLTNSINREDSNDIEIVRQLKKREGIFKDGFDYVVGNPPYLEIKKMPEELKHICRKNFPDIAKGAFDLYFCFIKMGLDLLREDGVLGYIIPNKFLVLKSAKWLRKYILDNFTIEEIADISNLKVFKDVSVYPILIFIRNKKEGKRIRTYDSIEDIEKMNMGYYQPVAIEQENFRMTEDFIFYTLPREDIGIRIYEKISSLGSKPLKEYLDIRWGISFHKRGIIDDFVFKEPKGKNPKPILGANIYSRDTEVLQYRIVWSGLWIDYDEEKAKRINNPFPPREIFETPKLIIRQNAEKLTVAIDREGKWYLKDVFFSGRLTEKAKKDGISLEFLSALLNSNLLNYYYSILFKGGHVNGGYLHFLVSYLNTLPIVLPTKEDQFQIIEMVNTLLQRYNEDIKRAIDIKVCKVYGLSDKEIEFILAK